MYRTIEFVLLGLLVIELILLGLVLPLVYVAGTVMFFNSFTPTATTLVGAGSLLCIGLGVTAIWRNRR